MKNYLFFRCFFLTKYLNYLLKIRSELKILKFENLMNESRADEQTSRRTKTFTTQNQPLGPPNHRSSDIISLSVSIAYKIAFMVESEFGLKKMSAVICKIGKKKIDRSYHSNNNNTPLKHLTEQQNFKTIYNREICFLNIQKKIHLH